MMCRGIRYMTNYVCLRKQKKLSCIIRTHVFKCTFINTKRPDIQTTRLATYISQTTTRSYP